MPRAAIDIGSNSLLLTILEQDGTILHDQATVVGLGKGLGDRGLFAPDRIQAAERVLGDYVATAKTHGIEPWSIKAVATSAARRAMNAETFFQRVQRRLGLRVKIISGEQEARLTWLGAQRDLALPQGPQLVVDLGGGSTEVVLGEAGAVTQHISLEIGSVRVTEAFLQPNKHGIVDPSGLARARAHIQYEVDKAVFEPHPRTVVGVAGTVTSLMAIKLGLHTYSSEAVHGQRLTRADLAGFIDRLLPMHERERRAYGAVAPGRVDFLLAGALILDRVLASSRRQHMVVSDRGLRFGLLK